MNVGGRAAGGANSRTNIDQLERLASPWRAGRGIEAVTGRMASTRIGRSLDRFEDFPLLTGRGRYAGDLPVAAGTLHAAVLRSPHTHAEILAIDASRALAMPGVECVVTGEDARRWTRPFTAAVRSPIEHWCLATGRVRYQGEPVAVVVASDRYRAEDALEAVEVTYRPLPATVDPRAAAVYDVVSDRRFRYGEPEAAFAAAAHRIAITTRYPRNACTPVECFVVVAEYLRGGNAYEVTANFQGPLALHPVMARALGVPANRLRLKTPPDSGGSFGVKQGVFPYIVLMAIAARKAGRPVKWVEDRLEHLLAANSATNRLTTLEAAVTERGEILALAWDQIEDCGAYLRAPEPATLYRMHGNLTGAYRVKNLTVRNRVVLTNKTPSGLNRGFGGPQVYFALERLMLRIAVTLGLDPLEVVRRNLVPSGAFPYHCPAGALLDSGDYSRAVETAVKRRRASRAARETRPSARRGPALRHRLCRNRRAVDLEHGLHHDGADRGGTRAPGPRAGRRPPRPWRSTRWAGSVWRSIRCRKDKATKPSSPRWSARSLGCRRPRSGSTPSSIPARTHGRSPPATIRAGLPARWRAPRISRRCGCATSSPASPPPG